MMKKERCVPQVRPVRICNISAAVGDHVQAIASFLKDDADEVDAITGDYLSEINISWEALKRKANPEVGYEETFVEGMRLSLPFLHHRQQQKRAIPKIVVNAGALNPRKAAKIVFSMLSEAGIKLNVATVSGDDILHRFSHLLREGESFPHLSSGQAYDDDSTQLVSANAYLGCAGITSALQAGADVVICGRVCDASVVMGVAAWWHGWSFDDYNCLASVLVAGHLLECGAYVTGANFSGFKQMSSPYSDIAYPIAIIEKNGDFQMAKQSQKNGILTDETVRAQLLYEIQGRYYLNPDVTADLLSVQIKDFGSNKVRISSIRGLPPPSTTKVMLSQFGGYQSELTFYVNGLDIAQKFSALKDQLRSLINVKDLSRFEMDLYGSEAVNPASQQAGTCFIRIFAQATEEAFLSKKKFLDPIFAARLQSFPGYHMNLCTVTATPRPFVQLIPCLMSSKKLFQHLEIFSADNDATSHFDIPHLRLSKSMEDAKALTLDEQCAICSSRGDIISPAKTYSETVLAPLGSVFHARSGDKGNNSNVGIFVRSRANFTQPTVRRSAPDIEEEYKWLDHHLDVNTFKLLLGDDYKEHIIERQAFPNLYAIHFRVIDFLDGGIASSSRVDGLGKGVGEYVRSRHLAIPKVFLDRGRI